MIGWRLWLWLRLWLRLWLLELHHVGVAHVLRHVDQDGRSGSLGDQAGDLHHAHHLGHEDGVDCPAVGGGGGGRGRGRGGGQEVHALMMVVLPDEGRHNGLLGVGRHVLGQVGHALQAHRTLLLMLSMITFSSSHY